MSSERYRTVVRRHHVRRRELQVLVATLVCAIVLGIGFFVGQRAAYSGMGLDPQTYRELQVQVPAALARIRELEQERDVSLARNEVDREALEMVRREISEQKEQIMDLEESLRFYQGLMAPEEIARGLVLRPVEFIATDDRARYSFRIIAQQEASKHAVLKGSLAVTVYGELDGEEASYPLSSLCEDIESEALVLRFRYFQAIEGDLILPEAFKPEGIRLVATSRSPSKLEVSEDFPWVVRERFTYVRK